MASEPSGLLKTFIVFTDLPKHIEYRALPMPVLQVGEIIRFDRMTLSDLKDRRRTRVVEGEYSILHRRLVYKTSSGLLQYLEMGPRTPSRAESKL